MIPMVVDAFYFRRLLIREDPSKVHPFQVGRVKKLGRWDW